MQIQQHLCLCVGIAVFSGSIDGNNQLIIKGRFQQKQIENVLRRYISKSTDNVKVM